MQPNSRLPTLPQFVHSNFEAVGSNLLKVADGETVSLAAIVFTEEQQARGNRLP